MSFWPDKLPIAIAHRGGAGAYHLGRYKKENTLAVFKKAVDLGYKYLELDVTTTADGKIIILHVTADKFEALLHKPSAPKARKLINYSYSQLKAKLRRDIPLLEDVLTSFNKTYFFIDPKTDEAVLPLAEVIKQTRSINRVCLNSFFVDRVVRLQKMLGEDLNIGVIIGRHPRPFNRRLGALRAGQYFNKNLSAITLPKRFLSAEIVNLIHKHHIKVLVWGTNTRPQFKKALKLGADGIVSDNITLLKQILG